MKQSFYMLGTAACLYRLGRLAECDAELDKSYTAFCGCFDKADGTKFENLLRQYRELYTRMKLDEYKPCV